jgi:hypothetical protein
VFAAACVSTEPEPPVTGHTPAPGLGDHAATGGTAGLDTDRIIETALAPDACVDEGCPAGLSCDWIQGCTDQVTFCCVDEMCGEGRFCDFEAGGVCTPNP